MNKIKKDKYKKALVVTTVASTIDQFCMNDISILQKSYKVYVAANFKSGNNTSKERINEFKFELQQKNIVINDIGMNRNPISKNNITAYKEIKRLIEKYSFDIIHCHTPVAAMLVRIAARNSRKNGTRVLYTAHGFHFYKGAPITNWIIYYPVEKWLSRYTDILITINKEDFSRANNSFKARKIEYIPGVGIDIRKFSEIAVDRLGKRRELGLPEDAFVVLSVGELNENKNHETIIKAVSKLNDSSIYYVICGQGSRREHLLDLSKKLGIGEKVKLLGFRKDIAEICKIADVFAFPSKREGLGLAALEAIASGLPIITSNVHGIVDYSIDEKTGYSCHPTDVESFARNIYKLKSNFEKRHQFILNGSEIIGKFGESNVIKKMSEIYKGCK